MAANYAGQYGDALRRLAALEAASSGQPVGPSGPAPMTGAFSPPQRYADDPSQPAFAQAGMQAQQAPGAMEMPAAPPAMDAPATGGIAGNLPEGKTPVSVRQIVEGMDKNERRDFSAGIKKRTGKTVHELYDQMVEAGEIAPPIDRKPNAKEKLPVLAEALLRFAQYAGQGMNGGAAAGRATMETQGRRQALEQAQVEQDNALAEGQRGEVQGVLNSRNARATTLADRSDERTYNEGVAKTKAADEKGLHEMDNAAALARVREQNAGENSRARLQNPGKQYTDSDGKVWQLGLDPAHPEKAVAVTAETDEPVMGGLGAFKVPTKVGSRKVQKQLQGVPGGAVGTNALDQDTIMNRGMDAVKLIMGDYSKMSEIKKRAKAEGRDVNDLIKEEAAKLVPGMSNANAPGGGQVIDFSELPN